MLYKRIIRSFSDKDKNTLALLDDNDDMSPEDHAIGMVIPNGFRLQELRSAALDSSLVKCGVLLRLGMGWFGGVTTRQNQERTRDVFDYRVQLEQHQIIRGMKFSLDTYNTEASAVVGAWVLLEPNEVRQTGTTVEGAGIPVGWDTPKQA